MRNLSLLLVPFLIAAGCSSEDDTPNTPESFCERRAEAACSADVISACQAASPEACRASQVEACLRELPATGFTGASADACIDAVGDAYEDADITADELETVLRFAAPCDRLISGDQSEGASCSSRRDCDAAAGFDCVFKGTEALGTCRLPERVGPGQDCSADNAVCDEGFYCNGDNCIAGEGIGEPCVTQRECGATGFCNSVSVCEARRAVNSPCGFDEQCESSLCYQFSATEQLCADRIRLSFTEPLCESLR